MTADPSLTRLRRFQRTQARTAALGCAAVAVSAGAVLYASLRLAVALWGMR